MINYEEWRKTEVLRCHDLVENALDKLYKRETLSLPSLVPELGIKEGDFYTVWIPPSTQSAVNPVHDIRNLETLYGSKNGKIIVPIHACPSPSDFKRNYGMSIEELTNYINENHEHIKLIITEAHSQYAKARYLDKFLQKCEEIYGEYLPFPSYRVFELMFRYSGRKLNQVEDYTNECLKAAHTLFDTDSSIENFRKLPIRMRKVICYAATFIADLKVFGFDNQASMCIELAKKLKNSQVGFSMLHWYSHYLVGPFTYYIGGIVNYDTEDLERMAFLRILPFKAKELEVAKEALLQSPAARSLILSKYECQINVWRGGKVNTKSLNLIIELAQKYNEVGDLMANLYSNAGSLNFEGAVKTAGKLSQVLNEQYSKEIAELIKKEGYARKFKSSLQWGSTLITWSSVLISQLPIEWKLLLLPAFELFKKKLFKWIENLDPKSIFEKLWRVENWPISQKGIPYLIWIITK